MGAEIQSYVTRPYPKMRPPIALRPGTDVPPAPPRYATRIIKLSSNVEDQLKTDLSTCKTFSICLDESTDVTSSARLAIIARYLRGDEMREELIALANLPGTTTGAVICKCVVKELSDKGIDLKKNCIWYNRWRTKYDRYRCWFYKFVH